MEAHSQHAAKTVVLVDDEDLVRRVVSRLLEREGYRVLEVSTAEDGLAILSNGERVDLLLTDVTLPGMNGVELGRRVLEERHDLKLICMSGSGEEESVSDLLARAAGKASFINKPFSPGELIEAVNNMLDVAQGPEWAAGA
jgi:two-component system, cell cycle sensor histidine kinase and response regulator CckA